MTNAEKYPTTVEALKVFDKTRPGYTFSEWLKATYEEPLPAWVKVGAKFRYLIHQKDIFTVTSIDNASERVNTTPGTWTPFRSFHREDYVEQYFQLPEWVKVGEDYTHCGIKFTIRIVDDKAQTVTASDYGCSTLLDPVSFSGFCTSYTKRIHAPKNTLPAWVQIGAMFKIAGANSSATYTVMQIDCTRDRVVADGTGNYAAFDELRRGVYAPCVKLPEWVKVGAKLRVKITRMYVYTVGSINYVTQQIHLKDGGTISFRDLANGVYEQYFKLPEWVKPGARCFREAQNTVSFKILSQDDVEQRIILRPEQPENAGKLDMTYQFFTDRANGAMLPINLPDWLVVGAEYTCALGCCTYEVAKFNPDGVTTTEGYNNNLKDFTGVGALKQVPKPPAWVKEGAFFNYHTDRHAQSRGPWKIKKVCGHDVIAKYVGTESLTDDEVYTPLSRFIDDECYEVPEPKKIPAVYFDMEDESVKVISYATCMYNATEDDIQDSWVKLEPK